MIDLPPSLDVVESHRAVLVNIIWEQSSFIKKPIPSPVPQKPLKFRDIVPWIREIEEREE